MTDTAGALKPDRAGPLAAARRIEIVVNPMSGGVGPKAAAECERLLARLGVEANIVEAQPPRVEASLQTALDLKPDVLIVLAGDGTARTAAAMAGVDGPLIAPLPGGTMNLLPKALYGTADWRQALERALTEGIARSVAGGEVDGHPFYCATILGSPALWAPAREAMRAGKLRLAFLYARRAARRAFSREIRFLFDGHEFERGQALALVSPLISKALDEPVGLEAAKLSLNNAAEGFRLAAKTLFSDWRADPTVQTRVVQHVRIWAPDRIPAILDGETVELGRQVDVRFLPVAFRALAPCRVVPGPGETA